jgi:hypothetical protein
MQSKSDHKGKSALQGSNVDSSRDGLKISINKNPYIMVEIKENDNNHIDTDHGSN